MVSYVWVLSRCFPIIFPLSYKDQLNNNQKSPHISTVPLQQPPEKKKKKKTFSRIAVGWYLLNLLHIFRFAISKNIYIDIYMYKYGIPISYSTIYIVCTNMEFQKISIYIVLDIYLGGSRFHRYPLAPRSKSCSSSKPCPLAPARPVRPKRWMYSLAQRGTPLDHQLMGLILWIVPSGKLT